jgi:hypothetical protein
MEISSRSRSARNDTASVSPVFGDIEEGRSGTLPMGTSRAGGPRKVGAHNRREQAKYQAEEQAN